jgi:cytochrome b561/polyisoprenoid-binding protein YceI
MQREFGRVSAGSETPAQTYSRLAMLLHWALAAAFAFELGLGWRMNAPHGAQTFAVYQLHKSVGISILGLSIARLAWRLRKPAPAWPAKLTTAERCAAHAVHVGFYLLLLGLPLTGWLIVSSSATAIPTMLFGMVHWPHMPGVATLGFAARARLNGVAASGHELLGYIAYLLIAAHVAGALKHQFVDKADDLGRMLPLPGKWLGRGLIAILLIFALAALLGWSLRLRSIGSPAIVASPVAPFRPAVAAAAPTFPLRPTAPVDAAPQPSQKAAEAPARPVVWQVRSAASAIRFHTAWSGGPVEGRFDAWRANIRFSPDALLQSSVKVEVDLASVRTGVAETQTALPGADWFAADLHPKAIFTAARFTHVGGDRYEARGTLTLRGVTRPLLLRFTLKIRGATATVAGSTTIDRIGFGVGQGDWAATTDLPANVAVGIALEANRQPIPSQGE